MIKRTFIGLSFFFMALSLVAEGPIYKSKDATTQLEFENSYQDVRRKLNKKGVTDGSNANSGEVGEYVESVIGSVNWPTSGQWGDFTSISLTAGDWDVTAVMAYTLGTATSVSGLIFGMSKTAGNSGTGIVVGSNATYLNGTIAQNGAVVSSWRVSTTVTTSVYMKGFSVSYATASPSIVGRLSARRVP